MRIRVVATAAVAVVLGLLPFVGGVADAASAIQIGKIQYDSPGTDTRSNASLDAEYVTIKNVSSTNRSLTGWTVRDAQNHVYTFGTFTLKAGKSVRLHTGKGTNTSTDRYWGTGSYIWNNTADKATLRNRAAAVIDSCSWSRLGLGYTSC